MAAAAAARRLHGRRPSLALTLIALLTTACAPARVNDHCAWPADAPGPRHLQTQVMLAEDLAIRYADARGVRPHWRSDRETCEAALFQRIAEINSIDTAAVLRARESLSSRPFDWPVNVPMGALTLLLASWLARWASRRFGPEERLAAAFTIGLGAAAIACAVVLVGHVWAGAVEMLRIGNGHLSYRALRIPWQYHRAGTFVIACATVTLVAAIRWGRGSASAVHSSGDVP